MCACCEIGYVAPPNRPKKRHSTTRTPTTSTIIQGALTVTGMAHFHPPTASAPWDPFTVHFLGVKIRSWKPHNSNPRSTPVSPRPCEGPENGQRRPTRYGPAARHHGRRSLTHPDGPFSGAVPWDPRNPQQDLRDGVRAQETSTRTPAQGPENGQRRTTRYGPAARHHGRRSLTHPDGPFSGAVPWDPRNPQQDLRDSVRAQETSTRTPAQGPENGRRRPTRYGPAARHHGRRSLTHPDGPFSGAVPWDPRNPQEDLRDSVRAQETSTRTPAQGPENGRRRPTRYGPAARHHGRRSLTHPDGPFSGAVPWDPRNPQQDLRDSVRAQETSTRTPAQGPENGRRRPTRYGPAAQTAHQEDPPTGEPSIFPQDPTYPCNPPPTYPFGLTPLTYQPFFP